MTAIEQHPLDMMKSANHPATFIMAQNTTYGRAENKPFWKEKEKQNSHEDT